MTAATAWRLVFGAPGQALPDLLAEAVADYQAQTGRPPAAILVPAGQAERINALSDAAGVPLQEDSRVFYRPGDKPSADYWIVGLVE